MDLFRVADLGEGEAGEVLHPDPTSGRKQLVAEQSKWERPWGIAMARVLRPAE